MKVLVTGASGHLGTAVCRVLDQHGHELRAADRRYRTGLKARQELADIRDELSVHRLMQNMDAVVHLANHPNPYVGPSPATLLADNTAMNANVFTAAVEHGVVRIVFASSVQVMLSYGFPCSKLPPFRLPYLPLDGECPVNTATNPYALSKHFGEQLLRALSESKPELRVTVLRYPMLVGEWQRRRWYPGPAPKLPRHAVDLHEVTAHLLLDDAAELVAAALEREQPGYHQYFPAQPFDFVGYDPARMVREFYPEVPLKRPLEELDTLIDLTAVQAALGWSPRQRIRAEIVDG